MFFEGLKEYSRVYARIRQFHKRLTFIKRGVNI